MGIYFILFAVCICVFAFFAYWNVKKTRELKDFVAQDMQSVRKMCNALEKRVSALEDMMESHRENSDMISGIANILNYDPFRVGEKK